MFRHYKLPCMLWAVALLAAVATAVTGEWDFTMTVLYGFFAVAETIRETRVLWRKYRRAHAATKKGNNQYEKTDRVAI